MEITPDPALETPTESTALATAPDGSPDLETTRGAIDADEAELERKMLAAADAGRETLSRAYERRLEALRAGKAADNVVAFPKARRA